MTHCFVIAKAITSGIKIKKSGIKKLMKSYFESLFYLISLGRLSGDPTSICEYLANQGLDTDFCYKNSKKYEKNIVDKLFSSKYFGRTFMKTSNDTAKRSFEIFQSSNRHIYYLYRIIFILTKLFNITIDFKYDRVGKIVEEIEDFGIIKVKGRKLLKKIEETKNQVLSHSKFLREGEEMLKEERRIF